MKYSLIVTKVTWWILALRFDQNTRPSSYNQFLTWIEMALPGGENMWMFGLATVIWATWKIHNRIYFEKIDLKNIFEVIFSAFPLMCYPNGGVVESGGCSSTSWIDDNFDDTSLQVKTVPRLAKVN
jgi:hypothetical protein